MLTESRIEIARHDGDWPLRPALCAKVLSEDGDIEETRIAV